MNNSGGYTISGYYVCLSVCFFGKTNSTLKANTIIFPNYMSFSKIASPIHRPEADVSSLIEQ